MPDNSRNPQQSGSTGQDQNKQSTGTQSGQSGQSGTDQDRSQTGQGSQYGNQGSQSGKDQPTSTQGTGTQRQGGMKDDQDLEREEGDDTERNKPGSTGQSSAGQKSGNE